MKTKLKMQKTDKITPTIDTYLLHEDWFWFQIIPYMLRTSEDEQVKYYTYDNRLALFGSQNTTESIIFNNQLCSEHIQNNEFFHNFIHVVEFANAHNTYDMLSEEEEQDACILFDNLKQVCRTCLLIDKEISNNFKEALSFEWNTGEASSVLQYLVRLMDSYYGLFKWGPYWTCNVDEFFTENSFPCMIYGIRNRLIDLLVTDTFERTYEYECLVHVLEEYNKEFFLLKHRRFYVCTKRPQMLNTFKIYPWDLIEEPDMLLEAVLPDKKIRLVITKALWTSIEGLKYTAYVDFQ